MQMTTEDKLRIIETWTKEFDVLEGPSGKLYGRIMITYSSTSVMSAFTQDHPNREDVIDEAYTMIYNRVWNTLNYYSL